MGNKKFKMVGFGFRSPSSRNDPPFFHVLFAWFKVQSVTFNHTLGGRRFYRKYSAFCICSWLQSWFISQPSSSGSEGPPWLPYFEGAAGRDPGRIHVTADECRCSANFAKNPITVWCQVLTERSNCLSLWGCQQLAIILNPSQELPVLELFAYHKF